MTDSRIRLQQAFAIEDEVERSWAIEALADEAAGMLDDGHPEALELCRLIYELGPDDDLIVVAYDTVRAALIKAGHLSLPPLSEVILALEAQYAALPAREKLLAVARTLQRSCQDDYPECKAEILRLLDAAHEIAPLDNKERKLRLTISAISR